MRGHHFAAGYLEKSASLPGIDLDSFDISYVYCTSFQSGKTARFDILPPGLIDDARTGFTINNIDRENGIVI